MSGPYNLKYIHLFVTEVSPGTYILSRNGRMADRVGRADRNLADDLHREAAEGKHRYFWFEYTPSAAEAHGMECTWFDRYHPTHNPEHPNAPLGAEGACPVKGCQVAPLAHARGQYPSSPLDT